MAAPRPLAVKQKDNRKKKSKTSEETKRHRGNRGGRGECTGAGGKKNTIPPLGTGRGLGRRSSPEERERGSEVDRGRQREVETPGKDNTGSNRYLGTGQGKQVGTTLKGKEVMDRARNSFGPPGMGGKCRRAVKDGGQERRAGIDISLSVFYESSLS